MASISDTLDMVAQVRDRLMGLPAPKVIKVCKKINTLLDAEHTYRGGQGRPKALQLRGRDKAAQHLDSASPRRSR